MHSVILTAAIAGTVSALLALGARRAPALGWFALSPLGLALAACGAWAALAGAITGATMHGAVTLTQPARLRPLGFIFGSLGWGVAAGLGGFTMQALRSAKLTSDPVALLFVLPAVAFAATLPMRLAGAPRWIHAALACTQEPWPLIIRIGWFGGDITVSLLLAVAGTAGCLLVPGVLWAPGIAMALIATTAVALVGSARSLARTRSSIAGQQRVRIAAVVVDGQPPADAPADGLWPLQSPEYRDIEATVARYAPHVEVAAQRGAELVVLPEVAVCAAGGGVDRWLAAVSAWASQYGITVMAPHFDGAIPVNTLTLVEPSGRRWDHDKQHPAPGLEPAPRERQSPGPHRLERGWSISAVICVDLDYADLIGPVRAAPGLLIVPANDWLGFEELHDRSAVWAAVLGETTVLRATGHGICSARDGTGTLLARARSLDGPTVLVVDVPLAPRL